MPPGRRPVGGIAAAKSRTAIVGAVAARANHVPDADRHQFFTDRGLVAGATSVRDAIAARRLDASQPSDDETGWLWETYEVDFLKLRLDHVIAWIPRPEEPWARDSQQQLVAALQHTPGILEIHEGMDDAVVVHAAVADALEAARLQSRLRELSPRILWMQ